jgi:hypothetical protein
MTTSKQVNQETSMIAAIATQIYEAGALYRFVEPHGFEVTLQSGTSISTFLNVAQFHMMLSLVQHLKSVPMGVQRCSK